MTTTQLNTVAAAPLWNSKTASQEDVQTLHQTIAKECDANMFKLFLLTCDRFGLDPFQRQIFPVVRNAKKEVDGQWVKVPTLTIQTGIDGFRVIAQRSMEYVGQTPPQWCGEDGKWVDVWLKPVPPSAAKIGVYRRGFVEPIVSVATYKSFVQTDFGGKPQGLWGKMPDVMLAKCCEASALRKAFPNDLSGIYEPAEGASEPIDVTSEGAHPSLRTRTTKTLEVETAPDVSVTDEVVALCNRLRAAFKLAGAPEADAETVCEKWTQDVVNGGKTFEDRFSGFHLFYRYWFHRFKFQHAPEGARILRLVVY